MPELPEVETTLRGIQPYLDQSSIRAIVVRNKSLRWPVPVKELQALTGQRVLKVERRAKYLLIHTDLGIILLHLGMSGSLRVVDKTVPAGKHDHIDIELSSGKVVRLNDPRRFGCCLYIAASDEAPVRHKLLDSLGPEPLSDLFDGEHLFKRSRGRSVALKNFIMDGKVVVGVGNIYASESLFLAGLRPTISAGRVSRKRFNRLSDSVKTVLANAIQAGGTTLNDFSNADGKPGYFQQKLNVYGRDKEQCIECASVIKSMVIGQRNTFYCPQCQTF